MTNQLLLQTPWLSTGSYVVDLILRVVTLVVAVAGVYTAWQGLQTWRRQLHGQASFDVARRLILAVYKLRNEMQRDRYVIGKSNYEFIMGQFAVATAEVTSISLEAEALLDGRIREAQEKLIKCCHEWGNAARRLIWVTDVRPSPDEVERLDSIVWERPENDIFGKKLFNHIAECENLLRPHLPQKPSA